MLKAVLAVVVVGAAGWTVWGTTQGPEAPGVREPAVAVPPTPARPAPPARADAPPSKSHPETALAPVLASAAVEEPERDPESLLPSLRGLVTDDRGRRVPRARVRVVRDEVSAAEAWLAPRRGPGPTATVLDGEFELRSIPDAPPWRVEVDDAADAAGEPINLRAFALDGVHPEEGPLAIRLETGRVVEGRVVGPDGAGVTRCSVTACARGTVPTADPWDGLWPSDAPWLTGPSGSFRLIGLPEGPLDLVVRTLGEWTPVQRVRLAARDRAVLVRVEPGSATIEGRVDAQEGRVDGVRVEVQGTRDGVVWTRVVRTDGAGRFVVPGLAAGEEAVLTTRRDDGTGWTRTSVRAPATALALPLPRSSQVEGEVVGPEGGAMARSRVVVRGATESLRGFELLLSTSPGSNRFAHSLPEGRYTVTAGREGSEPSAPLDAEVPGPDLRLVLGRLDVAIP